MQIVCPPPFRVSVLLWQERPSGFAITVLWKATFQLRPGEALLAADQEALQKEDGYWGHNPMRSLRAASDLSPMKPAADVVLTGHAFAPGRVPVRSLTARLSVGEIDKSIELFGLRWFDAEHALREGAPFAQMPLL